MCALHDSTDRCAPALLDSGSRRPRKPVFLRSVWSMMELPSTLVKSFSGTTVSRRAYVGLEVIPTVPERPVLQARTFLARSQTIRRAWNCATRTTETHAASTFSVPIFSPSPNSSLQHCHLLMCPVILFDSNRLLFLQLLFQHHQLPLATILYFSK